jgi:uncharacterized phage-associated protein
MLTRPDYEYLTRHISFADNRYRTVTSIKPPDTEELSKSEITVINEVVARHGHMSAGDLVELTHKEYAWINCKALEPLNVENIIHDLPEHERKHLLARYKNDSETDMIFSCA